MGQEFRLIIDGEKGTAGLRTLYDTGHQVTDIFTGSPVAIVRLGAVEPFISDSLRDSIVEALDRDKQAQAGKDNESAVAICSKLRMIPYHTVGGTGLLPAFCPQHMVLADEKGRNTDVTGSYIAVCRVLGRGEYDAIIGTDMVSLLERSGSFCLKH